MSYADSLRQQARWIKEALDPATPESQRIELGDVDVDELEDAATEIERLLAALHDALIWVDPDAKNESRYRHKDELLAAIRAVLGDQQTTDDPRQQYRRAIDDVWR